MQNLSSIPKKTGFSPWWLLLLLPMFYKAINSVERDALWWIVRDAYLYQIYPTELLILFTLTFFCSVGAVIVGCFSAQPLLRAASLILLFLTYTLDSAYLKITGRGIQISAFGTLEREFLPTATNQHLLLGVMNSFKPEILSALNRGLLVAGGLFLLGFLVHYRFKARWLLLVLLGILLAGYSTVIRQGDLAFVPSPLKLPLLWAYNRNFQLYSGPRTAVSLPLSGKPVAKHIIYIIDESVRGDFLSLNGQPFKTTPFLDSFQGPLFNFGLSSSVTTCSATTDLILRSGLQFENLPDHEQAALHWPSIFQYAQAAGFQTYYYDAQLSTGHSLFMNPEEVRYIDHFNYPGTTDLQDYQRDFAILPHLQTALQSEQSGFFLLRKLGAHFPYSSKYPPQDQNFLPHMDSPYMQENSKKAILGSYRSAVAWQVDQFLKELLAIVDLQNTVIIYTSDHGQSIAENGLSITHCDWVNPRSSQATVPLLLFGSALKEFLPKGPGELFNNSSQFQIFPSVLSLLGYSEETYHRQYGLPLWRPNPGVRQYLSGNIFGWPGYAINEYTVPEMIRE